MRELRFDGEVFELFSAIVCVVSRFVMSSTGELSTLTLYTVACLCEGAIQPGLLLLLLLILF